MKIRYSLIAIACAALVGCMDKDWNDPNSSEAYGNPSIKETNVITISELKNNYANAIGAQTDPYKQVLLMCRKCNPKCSTCRKYPMQNIFAPTVAD